MVLFEKHNTNNTRAVHDARFGPGRHHLTKQDLLDLMAFMDNKGMKYFILENTGYDPENIDPTYRVEIELRVWRENP